MIFKEVTFKNFTDEREKGCRIEDWPSCQFCRVHLLDKEMEEERVGSYREGRKNH